jgi:hypothetical protein
MISTGEVCRGSGLLMMVSGVLALGAMGCAAADNSAGGRAMGDPNAAVNNPVGGAGGVGQLGNGQAGVSGMGSTMQPTGTATGTGGSGAAPVGATGLPMPCNVATAVANNCQKCHGATPISGAPMSLLTYDDFQKPAKTKPALKVYQLAGMRINDMMKPMPPGGGLPSADYNVLNAWFQANAAAGTDADRMCAGAIKPPVTGPGAVLTGDMAPLVAQPGETCYELLTHQSTSSVDATKYSVSTGEHYEQFYYDIPWPAGTQGTRFGAKFDNLTVLHHWLLFTSTSGKANGFHETTSGTQLGDAGSSLLAGWAVGGSNVTMPADVGFDLPVPGKGANLNLQWHFFNSTGMAQPDGSAVQVCTVPAGTRPKLGSITWLGTENFNGPLGMPAGQKSDFGSTCTPNRTGMNATDPIHIFFFWPHMHTLGVNMKSSITHNGMDTEVFNKPFDFMHQVHYEASVDLMPGDTITSTCTFNNTTTANVPFGPSTNQEMCYQFAFSYPAHGLDNGVISLIGADNTCW